MADRFAPSASPPSCSPSAEVLCSSIPYHIQNNVHKIATVTMKTKRKSPSPPSVPSQYNGMSCLQQFRVCSQKSRYPSESGVCSQKLRFPSQSESCTSASSSSSSSLSSSVSSLSPSPSLSSSKVSVEIGRRTMLLAGLMFSYVVSRAEDALAVKQILLAGRVPGLSPPDENGLRTYRRPDEKSGGHGVGWSPIIPYSFKVPDDWEEVPVSIADLGGTEIDLRFSNQKEGNLSVVVAPVLRFSSDLGDNATIEKVGPPEKVIDAFGPEVVGQNVEGQVTDMEVSEFDGRTYYFYELKVPHVLITATAAGNRLYLLTVSANARQWKKYSAELKQIAGSFRVG